MTRFSGSMVLVDTSVFIHYFRGKEDSTFQDLVQNDQVLISDFVRLELLQGVKKSEYKQLESSLKGLSSIDVKTSIFKEAENMLVKVKATGLMIGLVDLLLAAQSNIEKCPLYSFDKVFEKLASLKLVAIL